MIRTDLLLAGCLLLTHSVFGNERPNIIIIYADDVGYGDIGETNNLVSVMPEKATELEAKLDEWLTAGEAYFPVPNPDFVPSNPK